MQIFFLLCLVRFSLAATVCAGLPEVDCIAPDCYFNYNSQECNIEYSSGMDEEMCAHGFPGSYWNDELSTCVSDPCIYWELYEDKTGVDCNVTHCVWQEYHNVKFSEFGDPTFVESFQCVRNNQVRDNPCYMLGPALFNPKNEYYCEYFDECEITVINDIAAGYTYENCDLKEEADCADVGVSQCHEESPTCFVSGESCVLDTCLRENGACPDGCVEMPFHDMTLDDTTAYYDEITQCVNSSAAENYNQCYLIKPSYCDHYEDCEEKVSIHGSHSHLICAAKKQNSSGASVISVRTVVKALIVAVVFFMIRLNQL